MKRILICICAFSMTGLFAQPGALDVSFSGDGTETTPVGTQYNYGRNVVVQPDGKIIVAGSAEINYVARISVVRYNANGTLDSTFDSDGIRLDSLTIQDDVSGLALQADGKIIVAAMLYNVDYRVGLFRYNSNGSLDSTFDSDGIVITNPGFTHMQISNVAIQPDGKIVVGGNAGDTEDDFLFIRYKTNGQIDTTFDHDGIATHGVIGEFDSGKYILIQPDGKIVQVGQNDNATGRFLTIRLNTNGSLDNSFDSDGIAISTVGMQVGDVATSAALQPDGKLVVAGNAYNGTTTEFIALRYHTNGLLDTSFNADGVLHGTQVGTVGDYCNGVAVQSNGKIVLGGHSTGSNKFFTLQRYNSNGSVDNTFDTDGIVTTDFGYSVNTGALALQPDGKIVLVGSVLLDPTNMDIAIARYLGDTISTAGLPETDLNNKITLYPNPVTDILQISNPYHLLIDDLKIYSITGQVMTVDISTDYKSINLSSLKPGNYFIQIRSGNSAGLVKIIKQ